MGGMAVVIIGYEVNDSAIDAYIEKNNLKPDPERPPFSPGWSGDGLKKLLRHLEEVTSTQVTYARIEDFKSDSHEFICCLADYSYNFLWNCEDVMKQVVPEKFIEIMAPLSTDRVVKRVFASRGFVASYDAKGRIR
ncbi:hypothetical protein BD410DRAFT_792592 [Rickenella mellea]|uniref:Uncharacterized protein n=1 Tax=Rickenella mellea TaxID=50990 RepID=A0A4Y7PU91_9AGAM|nr:hypothetical protein BD410DRAFT_792592 [Rickenella mellea]